ncbi:MAG: hypothetical protein LVS60_09220 [Nodosilinea sp. LVE1205-7]
MTPDDLFTVAAMLIDPTWAGQVQPIYAGTALSRHHHRRTSAADTMKPGND